MTEKKIESTRKVLENCDKKTRRIQERIVDGKLDEKMGDDMIREIQDKVLYAEMDLRKFKNELTNQQLHRQSLDIIWPDDKTTDCTDTEGMEKMRQKLFSIVRVVYVERIKDQKGVYQAKLKSTLQTDTQKTTGTTAGLKKCGMKTIRK